MHQFQRESERRFEAHDSVRRVREYLGVAMIEMRRLMSGPNSAPSSSIRFDFGSCGA